MNYTDKSVLLISQIGIKIIPTPPLSYINSLQNTLGFWGGYETEYGLLVLKPCSVISNLMTEAAYFSKQLGSTYQIRRCNNPEDIHFKFTEPQQLI